MPQANVLSFQIGEQWYGIPVDYVIEVVHLVMLAELPGSPPHVAGLMTLREMSMPVLDMRRLFNLPEKPLTLTTPVVAIRTADECAAFIVDDIDDVLTLKLQDESLVHHDAFIHQVVNLSGKSLLLLDIPAILTAGRTTDRVPSDT